MLLQGVHSSTSGMQLLKTSVDDMSRFHGCLLVLCQSAATNKSKQQESSASGRAFGTMVSNSTHLIRSFAVIVLIHVICNGVDIESTDYFRLWKATHQGIVHACRQGIVR